MIPKLKLSEGEPPYGYSYIGHFNTMEDAEDWYQHAIKANKKNPFFLNKKKWIDGKTYKYILWWKKPKSEKKAGRGFIAGKRSE